MNNNYILPITIVVAGLLIAGAVFFAGKSQVPGANGNQANSNAKPYNPSKDHILGNPSAPVKIIEYADLECPHCKAFNTTMHQVMDYYGKGGKVAWVYRPFTIFTRSPKEAEAAECAADQGGDTMFYRYLDKVYDVTPGEDGLDPAQLPVIAQDMGLNLTTFKACLDGGKYTTKVADSRAEAIAAGGQGTPYILVMANDQLVPGGNLSGNQPYDSMRAIIDQVTASLPASGQTQGTTTAQ